VKDAIFVLIVAVAISVVAFLILAGTRWFSAATVTISLHQPKPGVTCAYAVTSDGVALSCWKD